MLPNLLLYVGAALSIGGSFSRGIPLAGAPRLRVLAGGFLLLVLGAAWQVLATLSALGMSDLAGAGDYLTGVAAGRQLLWALLGLCLLLAAEINRLPPPWRLACAALSLWGLGGLGHGNVHGPAVQLLHAAHAGAMCLWLGGVLTLLGRPHPAAQDAARFSPYGLASLLTLLATGALLTVVHVASAAALLHTDYGRTLLLKLGVVVAALPAVLRVRAAFGRGAQVRRWLAAEGALLLIVLGVTASLSQQSPPSHQLHAPAPSALRESRAAGY